MVDAIRGSSCAARPRWGSPARWAWRWPRAGRSDSADVGAPRPSASRPPGPPPSTSPSASAGRCPRGRRRGRRRPRRRRGRARRGRAANRAIGDRGADAARRAVRAGPLRRQTHCNTGALAGVEWGTALGVVRSLHGAGQVEHVSPTRPARCCRAPGSPRRAGGAGRRPPGRRRRRRAVADRPRPGRRGGGRRRPDRRQRRRRQQGRHLPAGAGGRPGGHPVRRRRPESTVDTETPTGAAIEIEDAAEDEVLAGGGPAPCVNPAFDVTPADLVTAVVTERRVRRPVGHAPIGSAPRCATRLHPVLRRVGVSAGSATSCAASVSSWRPSPCSSPAGSASSRASAC